MEIVLASGNKKKIGEMNALLSRYCKGEVKELSLNDIGFEGDIEENGESFVENAIIKASAPAALGYIGIADDSGLCVNALGGAPGIYSARYSGEGATDSKNNEKLLCELENKSDRSASFHCTIALVVPAELGVEIPEALVNAEGAAFAVSILNKDASVCIFSGECPGEILTAYRGEGGFGYDPLFYVPEKGKTFSELSAEEKNDISHRGRAMRAFGEKFNMIIEANK